LAVVEPVTQAVAVVTTGASNSTEDLFLNATTEANVEELYGGLPLLP
jgi:hypothetical protein